MQAVLSKLIAFLESRWHTATGAFLATLSTMLLTAYALSNTTSLSHRPIALFSLAVAAATLGFWLHSHKLPKVPTGKIGVIFGLKCDSPEQQKIVTSDLFDTLNRNLNEY